MTVAREAAAGPLRYDVWQVSRRPCRRNGFERYGTTGG